MKILAIDIGGIMIKYGVISLSGDIIESSKIETEAEKGLDNILKKIDTIFNSYHSYEFKGIAVSATGQINGKVGKVIGGNPIIPNWIGTNLVEILEKKYNLPSVLENDVNCAALGEKWRGAAINFKNFICLTIGTGIGGGIVLNNQLFTGENSVAGEFGHMITQKGEYEKLASTSALIRIVKERTGKILNGKEIFLLENSDENIKHILDEWIDNITDGLANICYIFNPSSIILGGGVTKQGDKLLNKIKISLNTKIPPMFQEKLNLEFANLGNNSGMLGASYLLFKKLNLID